MRLKNLWRALFFLVGGMERAALMIACQYFQLQYPKYETSIGFATATLLISGIVSWVFLFGVFYPYKETSTPRTDTDP